MDAPPVQYVRTSDGYDIAYTVCGEGRPLLFIPQHWSHIQLSWQPEVYGLLWKELSERYRLILYDPRGNGMSTRGLPEGLRIEDYQRDLVAVVERLQPEPLVLIGVARGAHIAVQYALAHPQQVAALVLTHAAISFDVWSAPALYDSVAAQSWDRLIQSVAETPSRREYVRQSVTQPDWMRQVEAYKKSNIEQALTRLHIPSLVLHQKDNLALSLDESARTARLANAQLALVEGLQLTSDPETVIRVIDRFLGGLQDAVAVQHGRSVSAPDELSQRELDVLRLLAAGRSNQQIADELVISLNTVKRHVSNVFDKTGVANRAQAAAYAKDHGLA
jgi:pimeloyl-ACP methyl ester carboxylesterase/DNA-binding CsgD family transcriptional regulator